MEKNEKKLRPVSNEEIERILNSTPNYMSYGCGCGCGDGDGSGGSGSGFGWQPVGCGSGCGSSIDMGTGSGMGLKLDNHPYKGIYLSDDVMKNKVLATQLLELMASSNELMSALNPFKAGNDNLTINMKALNDSTTMESESYPGNYTISINSRCVNKDKGFDAFSKDIDNAGYKHDGDTANTFSVSFAHEALHAKHYFWYFESKRYGDTPEESVKFLKDNGFSDDFVNIFYENKSNRWNTISPSSFEENEHNYFANYVRIKICFHESCWIFI